MPFAPGTWGSLAALPCAWVIVWLSGHVALAAAALLVFAVGCWASDAATDDKDPGYIVIDEVAAQFLVLLAAPLDWRAYAAGFVLFRIFDIWKPPPIRQVERAVPGGLGIMLDDVIAAIYALILLVIGEGALGVRF
jgi:phosphatidylglycerophosphatase A